MIGQEGSALFSAGNTLRSLTPSRRSDNPKVYREIVVPFVLNFTRNGRIGDSVSSEENSPSINTVYIEVCHCDVFSRQKDDL